MKRKIPRKLSVVKFDFLTMPKQYHAKYPLKEGKHYLFLGEIANMPHHCVVVDFEGRVHWAFHTDNFTELSEEET
jgi:hypothetical protein